MKRTILILVLVSAILLTTTISVRAGGATDCPLYPSCSNKVEISRKCTNVLSRGILFESPISFWYVESCNEETITYQCDEGITCTFSRWNTEEFYNKKKIQLFPWIKG